ncbi:MAG: aspartate carbamoyltransferase catalytic subunit, partial [Pseudomonadota bacterium]
MPALEDHKFAQFAQEKLSCKHLLGIEKLSAQDIRLILDMACQIAINKNHHHRSMNALSGKSVINLFFENSTRTLVSFELAAKRLGADVTNIVTNASSIKKGESLLDTASTLNAMHPDFLIIRHPFAGVPQLLSDRNILNCAIVNGGDGAHEHPTQALLDALTIRRRKGRIEGLKIAICGDILHSRVARSNIHLLSKLGAEIRLCGPTTLMIQDFDWPIEQKKCVKIIPDIEKAISQCDIIMVLRLQLERMQGAFVPSLREYYRFFGINKAKLSLAKPDALIMHPGPINRGVEIASDIADDLSRSMIAEQVEMGVAVRMAV